MKASKQSKGNNSSTSLKRSDWSDYYKNTLLTHSSVSTVFQLVYNYDVTTIVKHIQEVCSNMCD